MSTQTPTPTQVRDAWDAIAAGFDQLATPHSMAFGDQVMATLVPAAGTRVIDVAAGSGALSIPAARRGADVLAVDISPVMIERLGMRARAEGLSTLETRVGDGEALDLDDDAFDLAVSMNGVSLFPDLERGLAELVRVTRPGGTVGLVTFGPLPEVEFIAFSLAALRAAAPDAMPAPPDPLPPFRLADVGVLRETLEGAGLEAATVDTLTWEQAFSSADDLLDMIMTSNPIAGQLTADLRPEQFAQARQVLDGMLRERSGGEAGAVLRATMRFGYGRV